MKNQTSTTKSIARIVGLTALVLLVPLVGMQLSDEVDWGAEDFVFAGAFFLVLGSILEFWVRRIKDRKRKFLSGLIVIFVFALVWIELAVGLFS